MAWLVQPGDLDARSHGAGGEPGLLEDLERPGVLSTGPLFALEARRRSG